MICKNCCHTMVRYYPANPDELVGIACWSCPNCGAVHDKSLTKKVGKKP